MKQQPINDFYRRAVFVQKEGWPRLWGGFGTGIVQPAWVMNENSDSVELAYNEKGARQLIRFFILAGIVFLLVAIGAIYFVTVSGSTLLDPPCAIPAGSTPFAKPQKWDHFIVFSFLVLMCLTPLIFIGVAIANIDRKGGPWFHYDKEKQLITLPRAGRTIQRQQALRWQLIEGRWAHRGFRSLYRLESIRYELQLIFTDQNQTYSVVVIGSKIKKYIVQAAGKIVEATQLPYEFIQEQRNWRNPYKKIVEDDPKIIVRDEASVAP